MIETDHWKLSRDWPGEYADWKHEVANGDTMLGFSIWCAVNRPHVIQSRPRQ